MTMAIELWDSRSANLVGSYDDVASALQDVVDSLTVHGMEWLPRLVLTLENEDWDDPIVLARGSKILALSAEANLPQIVENLAERHVRSETGTVSSAGGSRTTSAGEKHLAHVNADDSSHAEVRGRASRLAVAP